MTNWFPFFSMLFWCVTKLMGLGMVMSALIALHAMCAMGLSFTGLLFGCLMPLALGALLLFTEVVFDLATNEMRQRNSVAK